MPLVEIDLGRKHHLVARDVLFDRCPEVFLARPRRITVCRIEKVDAEVERMPNDLLALCGIERPCVHLARRVAEAHAAEAEPGYFDPAVSECRILHIKLPAVTFVQKTVAARGGLCFSQSASYCASVTSSSHSLEAFSPGTSTAMCENQLSFFAPCQCLTSGGMTTTSPGFKDCAGLPHS